MVIGQVRVLRGPNRWCRSPVFEVWVDLRDLAALDEAGAWRDRLLDRLPRPRLFESASREVEDRLQDWRSGGVPAHRIPETLARILMGLAGSAATFARTVPDRTEGRYGIILGYDDEDTDLACLEACWRLLRGALGGEPIDVAAEIATLRALANRSRLGPSTAAIVRAARVRGIPVRRLNDGSLIQLGWGASQRRFWTAVSDRTSLIASEIASDKQLTRALLQSAGVPAPEGRSVSSAADAWKAAQSIGPPVVVKPRNANHAQGVSIGLTSRDQVERAFAIAAGVRGDEPSEVLVERFIEGDEHRLLVVDGRFVAAYRGLPARVVGDGRRSIIELVEELNRDPRRGPDWHDPLDHVALDEVARLVLADQGFRPNSIPPSGAPVILQRTADQSDDMTDRVHPEVARRAVEAARVVGLDIAGIDLLARDIGRPLEEQAGAIVEVNAGPGLLGHLAPTSGTPRPVGEAIVASLFKEGRTGRIPLQAVTGGPEATAFAERLAGSLRAEGRRVGLVHAGGAFLEGRPIAVVGEAPADWTRDLLSNPLVDLAVVEVRARDVRERGLPFDQCDRAFVTGWTGSEPADILEDAARVLVESVRPDGSAVLQPDDPRGKMLASRCQGAVEWTEGDTMGA